MAAPGAVLAVLALFISPSGEPFRATPAVPNPFEAWFARVDVNHDGRIDRAEFRADAAAFFQRLDANKDGVIDGFEIAAYETTIAPEMASESGAARPAALLSEPEPVSGADLQLNSRITAAEWLTVTDQRFDLLDKKRQGFLEHDALVALLPKPGKARKP